MPGTSVLSVTVLYIAGACWSGARQCMKGVQFIIRNSYCKHLKLMNCDIHNHFCTSSSPIIYCTNFVLTMSMSVLLNLLSNSCTVVCWDVWCRNKTGQDTCHLQLPRLVLQLLQPLRQRVPVSWDSTKTRHCNVTVQEFIFTKYHELRVLKSSKNLC